MEEQAHLGRQLVGHGFACWRSLLGRSISFIIDPPFATGTDFSFVAPKFGEGKDSVFKQQSIIEEKAYRDTWGRGTSSPTSGYDGRPTQIT